MNMLTNVYEQYIWMIGQIKDVFKIHADADHKNIHTFTKGKQPLFKLMYGTYSEANEPNIVVSFHIDLEITEVVQWWENLRQLYPPVKVSEVFTEDAMGETYLGSDARKIRMVQLEQKILGEWLESQDIEEIQEFVESDIVGRVRDPGKLYDSRSEREKATIEFDLLKTPISDDEIQ